MALSEMALRGAVALSNAGASLISDPCSIETAAMPAFTAAIGILEHLCAGALTVSNLHRNDIETLFETAQRRDLQFLLLETIEIQVRDANRKLAKLHHLPKKYSEIRMYNMDSSSLVTMIQQAQCVLQFLPNGIERVAEARPIRVEDCSMDHVSMTSMEADMLSAIMIFNYGHGFLSLGQSRLPHSSMSARTMFQTSRQLFHLALDILKRYLGVFRQPSEVWDNPEGSDYIQSSTLLLFVWASVLSSDYQAALLLSNSSGHEVSFDHVYFQSYSHSLQELASKLLRQLSHIHGCDLRACSTEIGAAGAA